MKTKLYTLALAALTVGLLGSCEKDNGHETPQQNLPAGALSGKFTVNAKGKQVYFSKGNLYADGDKALHFEDAQWKSTPTSDGNMDASHVSHFTWSSTVGDAVGIINTGANLFCDESHKVSVDGGEAIYYALSKDEWTYLSSKHKYKWASVNGVNGYVIAPDDFEGTLSASYADDVALAVDNLVFLPAAGFRGSSFVANVGDRGYYWSSTVFDSDYAYLVYFTSGVVYPVQYDFRNCGYSVRLVTECQ